MEFIRIKLCVSGMFFGMLGYLLFNEPSLDIIWISASCFFVVACVYSYNNITDKNEDRINRGKINKFAESKTGFLISFSSLFLGTSFSYFISVFSFFLAILFVAVGIAYSRFRIKSYFLIKNLYTAFLISLLFLIGSAHIEPGIDFYYLLFFSLIFWGSIVSDLRDYRGDLETELKTLPVVFGYNKARVLVSFGISLSILSIVSFGLVFMLPLSPFLMAMILFLIKDEPGKAHFIETTSVIFLTLWLFFMGLY